jgi:hypothetical protein
MRPIFTVHAGEFLAATEIERFRTLALDVWIPSKDRGIDLLVTNPKNRTTVSLQIKFSKDFTSLQKRPELKLNFKATGWWKHKRDKIKESPADLWVFVLPSFEDKDSSFIVIRPDELLHRLDSITNHATHSATIHSYLGVTRTNKSKCWETRGTTKAELTAMIDGTHASDERDFSPFLNNWNLMTDMLK